MKVKYLAAVAVASALSIGTLASCGNSADVADPCAAPAGEVADPCAADPCAADPCAADPCAADPCAADPCAADPCAGS
ncbi:MAG: hypothetical protein AAFN18_16075 [Cyanobacteria bacterium J06554_6]